MCKLISHVHTLAFSFVNIICVNCINIFSLLYSTVLCIIYVPLYYVLFLLEEIKNYYYIIILYPSGSAHAYDRSTCDIQIFKSTVKPIPKDRFFFSCNCSFFIPGASSDTSKHDEVYDSAIC